MSWKDERDNLHKVLETGTAKDKIDFVWTYYKWQISLLCFIILFVAYLLSYSINSTDCQLTGVFLGSNGDLAAVAELKDNLLADILLEHPETIEELPKDTMFLNWYYDVDSSVMEQMISTLADLGCTQIVCPGTSSWNRFCERYEFEVPNILGMIRCGHRHGVKGILNTNWGDWGNL